MQPTNSTVEITKNNAKKIRIFLNKMFNDPEINISTKNELRSVYEELIRFEL